ncbi:phage tail protein [Escherichia coli]|uniref:phage tail-collar fiber domain-containing protein n=2 Tax=Escherichia coli TaxID=562 RepID=UPI0010AB7708|nr:phage tail protein [Escherichia coli]EER6722738.1 phage tail protein [Escherichia coli]EES0736093.1 phage tail protein [Escherichia coli]EEX1453881.1 phage tail protein [Escherichia coli]EEX5876881.1 phage tail protein [Escherichia coli]EFA5722414.1 phage tail protein [Escherichia coli]
MSTTTRKFKTVITDTGTKKLAQAAAPDGKPVRLTHMAVGDGGGTLPTPDSKQTRLVHEVWRHTVNRVILDATHQNRIIAELVIPPETGGFWIREIGVFDEHGDLIAVGNTAESYKPAVAEGSGRAQTFRTILTVSSTATVALTVDNTMVMATVDYVDDKLKEHEQSRRHPDASLTAKGFVQLSSATNSTSETQAATPKALKAAYDLANAKYTAQDATTAQKGIVQLSSATNSTSETLAATPKAVKAVMDETNKKAPLNSPALTGTPTTPTARQGTNNTQIASTAFVMAAIAALVDSSPDALNTLNELAAALGNDPNFATTMTNALAGKQPKDATLTALAGLATAADKFPYFTGNDVASLATLTEVGRDILAKSTVAAVIEYLGLQETVNKAGNAVQRSGDKMTGELKIGTVNALRIFNDAFGLIFRRSEDFLHFIPTAEGQGENGDIGPLRPFAINLRTGAISVSHGAKIEGGLAIGATDNALGENSIVLGDNDTGFRQDGDGIISFYSNGSRIGHIDELGLHIYKDIESNGSNFRLKGNYRHHITFANEDGSIRMFLWKDKDGDGVHINNGSSGGGDFVFKTNGGFALGSGAQVASNGDIYGSVWENNWLSTWLHNHVVRDIRLGSIEYKNVWRDYGFGDASGYVLTAAINSNADDIVDTVARRPIQKLIGGIWYNVGSV